MLLARTRLGWSRAQASDRAGVSRSTWERVERGSTGPTIATACAVSDAVGLDLVIRAYPGSGPTLHDRGQMVIAAHLSELAHSSWRVSLEVTAGTHGEAIDQVFWGPDEFSAWRSFVICVTTRRSIVLPPSSATGWRASTAGQSG